MPSLARLARRFSGRSSGAVLVLAATVAACERSEGGGGAGSASARSESIRAASTTPVAAATASGGAHASAKPPRKLCDDELGQPARKLPKGSFTGVAASGAARPAGRLTPASGRWTWVNFFAAWCGPCKEEMPRLRDFQQRLAGQLDVVFVSLDDDERQLRQFLEQQPLRGSGVRSALWLEPGKGRTTWLAGLAMKESPDLPAHVLVDPSGKVRCVTGGAVEDGDFPAIETIVAR